MIRNTSAVQIASIVKTHPDQLSLILNKLWKYLYGKKWDTRVAAAVCIDHLAQVVSFNETFPVETERNVVLLNSFETFDLDAILLNGKTLLSSGGNEHDADLSHMTKQERLAQEKQSLNNNLGMMAQFVDDDLVKEEDLIVVKEEEKQLSARERNRLKRKAKENKNKQKVRIMEEKVVVESKKQEEIAECEWPFERFCKTLQSDLLNECWEIRHGAALGLRDILKHHGAYAGRQAGRPKDENDATNVDYLVAIALQLISVFALDRFGDFVGDTVVTPVRETCAQTMGAIIPFLPKERVMQVKKLLISLCNSETWEVRHAGMVAMKYVGAIGTLGADMSVPDDVALVVMKGLQDFDDDIRSVAAQTLLPIANYFVSSQLAKVNAVVDAIWAALEDLKEQELTGATASIMDLLGAILSIPEAYAQCTDLDKHVSRLFHFFRNPITSVRLSVINMIQCITKLHASDNVPCWLNEELVSLLLQNLLIEDTLAIMDASLKFWTALMTECKVNSLPFYLTVVRRMFSAAVSPLGTPFDISKWHGVKDALRQDPMVIQDMGVLEQSVVIRSRIYTCTAIARGLDTLASLDIKKYLYSHWAWLRVFAVFIVEEWALSCNQTDKSISKTLMNLIEPNRLYSCLEVDQVLKQLHSQLVACNTPSLPVISYPATETSFNQLTAKKIIENATNLSSEQLQRVNNTLSYLISLQDRYDVIFHAQVAAALVSMKQFPTKLGPMIRALMNSIKFEENEDLQKRMASALTRFLADPVSEGVKDKIVNNLCAFLCSDTTQTLLLRNYPSKEGIISIPNNESESKLKGKRKSHSELPIESSEERASKVISRGAFFALQAMSNLHGETLFSKCPKLIERMNDVKAGKQFSELSDELGQKVIDSLMLIRTLVPLVTPELYSIMQDFIPGIGECLIHPFSAIRNAAAKCLATLCKTFTVPAMVYFVQNLLPLLDDMNSLCSREGIAEALFEMIGQMEYSILPFVVFLVIPLMGRMSDSAYSADIPNPDGFPKELLAHKQDERKFLEQMFDNTKLENYSIPVKINAELRPYQQEGVNWMSFLNKYQLHGILCDDMGLGKTLQTICMIASDHHVRREQFKLHGTSNYAHHPSIVVCPPTLTGHWFHEITRYVDTLVPFQLVGPPNVRRLNIKSVANYDIIITSYDILRNDIEHLQHINWNYVVLDEGHIIKNSKTKLSMAAKQLQSLHRLILSGTPIQNNVLELWSLFDFLMPGFLGTEQQFNEKYSKPILASRDSKVSSKEQERGALALEALHKQLLPFLLRRLKEEVLQDLPPKIIQDYCVELSPLQMKLYEDFSANQAKKVEDSMEKGKEGQTHVFQSLQYLRKLCNHPSLVLNPSIPGYDEKMKKLNLKESDFEDINNSPKILALRQLLLDCGIGEEGDTNYEVVSQHRVLVFAQLKSMLGMIENVLFKNLMPRVSYLKLDGSVPTSERHGLVQKFNDDPSIDVLLMTTRVGGLGLNLTSADTVIFVENDWNFAADLQAMDRAHRLGQKKVVNVYRLITKNTLEEKIMGFKMNVANSVVTQQNAGLASMDTDQIVDLFSLNEDGKEKTKKDKGGRKAVLENLEELWNEEEYEDLNVGSFLGKLK